MLKSSEYQLRVYDFIQNDTRNGLISAVAGSGKTTTLIKSLDFIDKNKKVLFCAFNKSIATEIKERVGFRSNVDIKTIHGLGFEILKRNFNFEIDNLKYRSILVDILNFTKKKTKKNVLKHYNFNEDDLVLVDEIKEMIKANDSDLAFGDIINILNLARLNLIDLTDENAVLFIDKVAASHDIFFTFSESKIILNLIKLGISYRKVLDFTDLVFLPVYFDLKAQQYDLIFIDECQDLNKTQRTLILNHIKEDGRFIAVGDENQCIYQFAGADVESYNKLRTTPNTIELPLSISYRCGKEIVSFIRQSNLNNKIEAFENNPDGEVIGESSIKDLRDGDMVLCALTYPLVVLCLSLLEEKKSAYIVGSDVGINLINIIKEHSSDSMAQVISKMEQDLTKKIDNLIKKYNYTNEEAKNENSISLFLEKISILKTLSIDDDSPANTIALIEKLFNNTTKQSIRLSTVHKSKGLENDRVFILEPNLLTLNLDSDAGRNLYYVALSRAKKTLGFIRDFDSNVKKRHIKPSTLIQEPEKLDITKSQNLSLTVTSIREVETKFGKTNVIDFVDVSGNRFSKFEKYGHSFQVGSKYDCTLTISKINEFKGTKTYMINRFIEFFVSNNV